MSSSLEVLTDACVSLAVVTRKMFGGHGFFAPNGGMFAAIVTDDQVILKLEAGPAREELVELGGKPWTYTGQSEPMTMQNWIVVPERFYDDAELFSAWAARAHSLAPPKKAKAPKKTARPAASTASAKSASTAKSVKAAKSASATRTASSRKSASAKKKRARR
jgi:TfoX/Sxy family transcriptional regulator of competence genes